MASSTKVITRLNSSWKLGEKVRTCRTQYALPHHILLEIGLQGFGFLLCGGSWVPGRNGGVPWSRLNRVVLSKIQSWLGKNCSCHDGPGHGKDKQSWAKGTQSERIDLLHNLAWKAILLDARQVKERKKERKLYFLLNYTTSSFSLYSNLNWDSHSLLWCISFSSASSYFW